MREVIEKKTDKRRTDKTTIRQTDKWIDNQSDKQKITLTINQTNRKLHWQLIRQTENTMTISQTNIIETEK